MHPAIIIETVRSLWKWLWGRYHVPPNAFLVFYTFCPDTVYNRHVIYYFQPSGYMPVSARFICPMRQQHWTDHKISLSVSW